MAVTVRKFNPGFLSDDEVAESFCVRVSEFERIIESLSENDGGASSHMIVIGPRGSGKTHLLRRAAVEMRRGVRVAGYFPIEFAEESYEVSSVGEFWLEGLGRLAEGAPPEDREGLRLAYEDLRAVRDDDSLATRCLGMLLNFADRRGKRLVLIVENLNMLLPEMSDPDAGWKLRKTLQTEPRITLLGSATSRFAEIDHPDHALYDIFTSIELRPLNFDECVALWETVAGRPGDRGTIRAMQILTGGSPRMIAVVAGFRETYSFNELMDNLLELIDDHTEYFKGHIDALPAQERRVYLALARLWKPAETAEIADQARMDSNRCSAFLRRLVSRGAVTVEGGTARRRRYYLTERLYNIYYLLRRPSDEGRMVRALIEFMAGFYSSGQMMDVGRRIAGEYGADDARMKRLQQLAFLNLLLLPEIAPVLGDLLTDTTVVGSSISDENPRIAAQVALALLERAESLGRDGRIYDAIEIYDEVALRFDKEDVLFSTEIMGATLYQKSVFLLENNMPEDALIVFKQITNRFSQYEHPMIAFIVEMASINELELTSDTETIANTIDDIAENHIQFQQDFTGDDIPNYYTLAMSHLILSDILERQGATEEALIQIEMALEIFIELKFTQPEFGFLSIWFRQTIALCIIHKGVLLSMLEDAISESDALILTESIVQLGKLLDGSIEVMTIFCAKVGPERALEVIRTSQAGELMPALVVALQQELGGQPEAASEVAKVANDIRRRISEISPLLRSDTS